MNILKDYNFVVKVRDNGWGEDTPEKFIWHRGDLELWAAEKFGIENSPETWMASSSAFDGEVSFYFANELDYSLFLLHVSGNKINYADRI